MQTHGRLAGSRPTLHDQALLEWGTNDEVLLGLNGGHDLAHGPGAGGANLCQYRVRDTGPCCLMIGVIELFVEVGGQLAGAVLRRSDREATTMGQTERVGVSCAVEGRRNWCPPINDHGVVLIVFDVPAADVPTVVRLVGDATEEVAGAGRVQVLQCLGNGDLDVLLGDLVGRGIRVQLLEAADHLVATRAREGQLRRLGRQLGKQVSAHRADHATPIQPAFAGPASAPQRQSCATG